jgi:hypothetical protein
MGPQFTHHHGRQPQLSVTETAEQTKAGGVRYKSPKNGKGRTVAFCVAVRSPMADLYSITSSA